MFLYDDVKLFLSKGLRIRGAWQLQASSRSTLKTQPRWSPVQDRTTAPTFQE